MSACPPRYSTWLIDDAPPGKLVFGFARSEGGDENPYQLERLSIRTCSGFRPNLTKYSGRLIWLAKTNGTPDTGPHVTRFTYGEHTPGLVDSIPPTPLGPGCYVFNVDAEYGSDGAWFVVDTDGKFRKHTAQESDSLWSLTRQHQLAEEGADARANRRCREAYESAKSSDDTLKVDERVPYDTTRFSGSSCGYLRELHSKQSTRR